MRVQAEDGIVKLAMEDLVKEGVFSDIYGLGYEYVRVTEKIIKKVENKEKPNRNSKKTDKSKKFRQHLKAEKIKAKKETKNNRYNPKDRTDGIEH